jgi:hypothetical protein
MIGGNPKVSDLVLGARNMIEAAEVLRSAATKNLILSCATPTEKKQILHFVQDDIHDESLSSGSVIGESMDTLPYHDFRSFIEEAKKVSEWRLIEGADWDSEIGALIEATAELDSRPMLLFDKIKDYPAGFRLVSLAFANYKRTALAFGISPDKSKLEVVRCWRAR